MGEGHRGNPAHTPSQATPRQEESLNQATGGSSQVAGQRGNPAHLQECSQQPQPKKRYILLKKFYEKPVTSNRVFQFASAHPIKKKLTTLGQEVVRRMRTTCRKVKTSERIKILYKYI